MLQTKLDPSLFSQFVREVYRHTGITMDQTKLPMLSGRLRRRSRALSLGSFEDYLGYLRNTPSEVKLFVDAVTTNKTSMFRTADLWTYLRQTWLPEHAAAGRRSVRAWSAACSSGEEAASLAIMLAESSKTYGGSWDVTASDISGEMVDAARAQTFAADRIDRDAAAAGDLDLAAHFMPPDAGGRRQLSSALRRNMSFQQHNLFDAAPVRDVDLVFVRNVIIYFSAEDKERVLERALRVMRPGGLLVIGESESLVGHRDDLELVSHCAYRRVQP